MSTNSDVRYIISDINCTDERYEKAIKLEELRERRLEMTVDILSKQINTMSVLLEHEFKNSTAISCGPSRDIDTKIEQLEESIADLDTLNKTLN